MSDDAMTPQQSARVLRITGHVLVVLGAALLHFGVYFMRTANESDSWPETEGVIVSYLVRYDISNSQRGRINPHKDYYYTVTYRYIVEGDTLRNNQYNLGNGNRVGGAYYDSEEEARAAAQKQHPMRGRVSVWYNPEDPTMSVLEPGASSATYVPLILGFVFLGCGILLKRVAERTTHLGKPVAEA